MAQSKSNPKKIRRVSHGVIRDLNEALWLWSSTKNSAKDRAYAAKRAAQIKKKKPFERTASALTLSALLGIGGAALASTLAACANPLQDELDAANAEKGRLEKENEELKAQKIKLEADLTAATEGKAELEAQIGELEEQIKAKQGQIDTLTAERNVAQAKIDGIRQKLIASGKTAAEADAIIADISTLTGEIADLTAQLATANNTTIPGLETQIADLRAQLATANDTTIPGLETQIADLRAQLDAIAGKLTLAEFSDVDAVLAALAKSNADIDALNDTLYGPGGDKDNPTGNSVAKQLADAKTTLATANSAID
ncbi:MAG: hypothetical protein LBT92_00005, partial [Rickettsiales bacterium]|nr:hypothetical protein [Rickettsiales bacterium]